MLNLVSRHLRVYFANKATMFFGLLSLLILLFLVVFFMGESTTHEIINGVTPYASSYAITPEQIETQAVNFTHLWVVSGLITLASLNTALSTLGQYVKDAEGQIMRDFFASPVSRTKLTFSYLAAAGTNAFVHALVISCLGLGYLAWADGVTLTVSSLGLALVWTAVLVLVNAAMLTAIISFVSSIPTFSIVSTLMGIVSGIASGVYLPIGVLSEGLRNVFLCFPPSIGTVILRQVLFGGADNPLVAGPAGVQFKGLFGIEAVWFGYEVTPVVAVVYLGLCFVVFGLIGWGRLSKKTRG